MCSRSGVGLTMSCKSDRGFVKFLPAGICTGWTGRRGLTGMSLFCGGGGTNVGMGVGGLQYKIFLVGCSGELKVVGELFFLLLFLRGGEVNISGLTGLNSVSGGFSSSGEEYPLRFSIQTDPSFQIWMGRVDKIFCLVLWSKRG